MKPVPQLNTNLKIFDNLKNRLLLAQTRALYKVNLELLEAYFDIGKSISENLETQKWGSSVIDTLAEYFKVELPGTRGLNKRNLYYMKSFYERYRDFAFVQEAPAKLTWTHHQVILDGTKTIEEAMFYVNYAIKNQYSSVVIKEAVKKKEIDNYNLAQNNFDKTYPTVKAQGELIIGDETNLDFLLLAKSHKEKELENGIVNNIVKFLNRMGGRMSFVGKQYPVKYSEDQYFMDLLFYHLDLNCYIVIELKSDKFKADYIGQLALYIGAVNKEVKKQSDNPTIGILICRDKDRVAVEYLLDTINAPIGVSTYSYTELPESVAKYLPNKFDFEMDDIEQEINNEND
jgi:predicted nuclease of restriction endonuclease-like (RecB) superfamily